MACRHLRNSSFTVHPVLGPKLDGAPTTKKAHVFRPVLESYSLLRPRQKTGFLALVGARVIVHILDVIGLGAVGLLGAMLASGLSDRTDASFLGVTIDITGQQSFVVVISVTVSFFLLKSILSTLLLRATTVFLARVEAEAATEVARYLFSGSLERLRSYSRGDIQWAVSQSSHTAFSMILYSGSALVTESALFLAVFSLFLVVDPVAAVAISAYFILLISIYQWGISARLRLIGRRLADTSVKANDAVLDLNRSFREATVLDKRDYFLDRFERFRTTGAKEAALQRFLQGFPRFFVEAALMVGILGLIAWQFASGTLEEGIVITGVFLTGGVRMMAALLPLQNALITIRTMGPQAERAQTIIRSVRDAQSTAPAGDTSAPAHVQSGSVPLSDADVARGCEVTLESVSFQFSDADQPVIDGATLTIEAGSFTAFVGPSGAGKTTLADLILGVQLPSVGTVTIDGISPQALRRLSPGQIAYVPQAPGTVSGTIARNVALGVSRGEIDEERVWQVLALAELDEFVRSLPEGIHSDLGRQADSLSGGQIQRLGLARALYTKPRLLVLDEATSALDAGTEASIAESIRRLAPATTLLVVAHRLSTIQRADRVFVIDEGGILAQGTFAEVRKAVPLIEQYVQHLTID